MRGRLQASGSRLAASWESRQVRRSIPESRCTLRFDHLAGARGQRAEALLLGELTLRPHPTVQVSLPPDWTMDPHGDGNWVFQFHSLRWLICLLRATESTGRRRYLRLGLSVLRDWHLANPPDDPPSEYSWNDHATAWRARVIAVFAESLDGRYPSWLQDALERHVDFLADASNYVQRGNHALNQNAGLFALAVVLRRSEAELAVERTVQLLRNSVDLEGVTDEQATEYQRYDADRYREVAELFEGQGLALDPAFKRLERMTDLLAWATLPDGTVVGIGDSAIGTGKSKMDSWSWAKDMTEHEASSAPLSRVFRAGYAFARSLDTTSERGGDLLCVRFGAPRARHGHDDGGSVSALLAGQRVLEGSGKYAYRRDDARDYVLSRRAQNVVSFRGGSRSVDRARGTELETFRDAGCCFLVELIDRREEGVVWKRAVALLRDRSTIAIIDRYWGDRTLEVEQRLRIHPDLSVGGADDSATGYQGRDAVAADGRRFYVSQVGDLDQVEVVTGLRDPLDGWMSRRYGHLEPASVLVSTHTGATGCFVTTISGAQRSSQGLERHRSGDEFQLRLFEHHFVVDRGDPHSTVRVDCGRSGRYSPAQVDA